jgi:hypothetical protein
MTETLFKDSADAQGRGRDMQNPIPLKAIASKLKATGRVATFLFLVMQSPLCSAAIYKCIAKDGSRAYSDAPCATDVQTDVRTPSSVAPTIPAPATATSKPDPTAMQCAISQYIHWIRAQSRPLDPALKSKKTSSNRSGAWSPDGRKLAFRSAFEASKNCDHQAFSFKFDTGNFPCLNGSNLYTGLIT